jgi:hypothetical protein
MQNRECGLDVWTGAQIRECGPKHRPEAQTRSADSTAPLRTHSPQTTDGFHCRCYVSVTVA